MRPKIHLLLLFVLTVNVSMPATSWALDHRNQRPARPPKLMAIPDSVTGPVGLKSTLMSDGVRYATFRLSDGRTVILDTKTGQRLEVPESACPKLTAREDESPAFTPENLTGRELISKCYHGPGSSPSNILLITSLPGLKTETGLQLTTFPFLVGDQVAVGSVWARYVRCEDYKYGEVCPEDKLFNFGTGAVYPGRIKPSATSYADLNAKHPIQHLCAPIRLANPHLKNPIHKISETVLGVEGHWVLINKWHSSDETEHLLAWHCGARRPLDLGLAINTSVQLGAGLVSWFDGKRILAVENLTTRHRWYWSLARVREIEYIVCHTADTVFVAEAANARSGRVFAASLKGLGASHYQSLAPAVVAVPTP